MPALSGAAVGETLGSETERKRPNWEVISATCFHSQVFGIAMVARKRREDVHQHLITARLLWAAARYSVMAARIILRAQGGKANARVARERSELQ